MLCAPFYTMLCTCLVKTLYGINYNNNNDQMLVAVRPCKETRHGCEVWFSAPGDESELFIIPSDSSIISTS